MAGLTSSTFHHSCKSQLPKPLKPLCFHLHTVPLRILTPKTTHYPSISTTISARRSNSSEDEALDFSLIKSDNVRLIDQQQKMVGIVSKAQAFQMAEDAELDLVILSLEADPPVVRIMEYNKYKYEQQKKKRDQQKKSAASRMDLKELKMGYNIDVHDYNVRLKAARKFLTDGDKLAVEEAKNFRDRNIFIVLVPNKALVKKPQEAPKKRDNSVASQVSAAI